MKTIVSLLLVVLFAGCASSGKKLPQNNPSRTGLVDEPRPGPTARPPTETTEQARLLTAYFDYDDSGLRADAKGALRQNAEVLRQRSNARVELQGNCDERGTDEYNMALGKRRAEGAKRYLADLGIPDSRMTTVSFGEENPAVQGTSEAAWAKNRRVDFVLR